ncbi:MAG: beta-lactamase family protein [Verrucomicrobiota bacterium]|nr:beta-lactamase family protein [Verrucomicrobiota bacterium]
MRRPIRRLGQCVLVIAVGIAMHQASAQGPAPSPLLSPPGAPPAATKTIETPAIPHALTRDDLAAFLDALIPSQLANRNMAGAVVGVVKDGEVLFTKGYGYADFANKKPVVAAETLFRPGSISKLFTATAVMQLVEQGKLDLDRDVNEYLDFKIPRTYPEPVTLRRILTHTAGFEETVKNLFVTDAGSVKPLRDYLIASMPVRIFAPGQVPSYSNWAITLAGYIVARVSAESFDDYIDAHILRPLRMEHSTFRQPLPANLAPAMSDGYIFAHDKPRPFEFVQAAPAGALSATADDMCRFMLALLGKGTLEGATILKPGTLEQMQSRQFEVHPALNALGLVFMQYDMNGFAAWGHGGDTICFHSDLWMVPDAQFGFFISYNSAAPKPGGGRGEVMRALFDRYFAAKVPPEAPLAPAAAQADARAVAGTYVGSRRSESTFLKVGAMLGQSTVSAAPDGTITVDTSKNARNQVKRWREIGPLLFHEIDGPEKLAFRRASDGRVTEMLTQPPIQEAQRVPWFANNHMTMPAIGGALAFLLLTAFLWPVAALVRRRYHHPLFEEKALRIAFVISRLVCIVIAIWLLVLIILGNRAGTDISLLGDGLNGALRVVHFLGWLIVVGMIWLLVAAVRFWSARAGGIWLRVHATVLALSAVALVWFMWQCHFLDASLRF